ncbi:MAG: biotin--[acetyl-CoA-carboxylase] ligase [bacterium]|nr:biotin--[acetyl-CoA-carboxylase] ligase [bacterium]
MAITIFGKRIYRLDSVPSTQDALKEQFLVGAPIGSIAVAAEQSLGRGRRGRAWDSPAGKGLWTSVLVAPSGSEELASWTPLWVAVVVKKVLESIAAESNGGFKDEIFLKWPNDLILREKKLGGILAENVIDSRNRKAILVGLGINLTQSEDDFLPHLRNRAISLWQAVGETYLPELVLERIIFKLEELYYLLNPIDADSIRAEWIRSAWGWNQMLRVYSGGQSYEGKFTELGPFGELGLKKFGSDVVYLASTDGIQRVDET